MSVTLIQNHDESIYDVVEKVEAELIKSPRYKSIYSKQVRLESMKVKEGHRTMGFAKYPLRTPKNFLKKKAAQPVLKQSKGRDKKKKSPDQTHVLETSQKDNQQITTDSFKECNCPNKIIEKRSYQKRCNCVRKPDIPKREILNEVKNTKEIKEKKSDKNIIIRNILNVIKATPKTPVPRFVDTRYGTRHNLMPSGLEPHYILQKSFGSTPKYILRLMNERETKEQIARDEQLKNRQPKCRYITRREREELLEGLKKNWEELQKKYQGLPIMTDSVPKILRKSQMETELKQLEKDIVLVERHPYIYVYKD